MTDTLNQEVEGQEEEVKDLADLLKKQTDAPTPDQIDTWKRTHGEVFTSGFSETEMYVWRPLHRAEFRTFQEQLASGAIDQLKYEELVVDKCVLWPNLGPHSTLMLGQKAGTVTTLAEQIMQNSNFLPPQLAASLIRKL